MNISDKTNVQTLVSKTANQIANSCMSYTVFDYSSNTYVQQLNMPDVANDRLITYLNSILANNTIASYNLVKNGDYDYSLFFTVTQPVKSV